MKNPYTKIVSMKKRKKIPQNQFMIFHFRHMRFVWRKEAGMGTILSSTKGNIIIWGSPVDPWGNGATELTPNAIDEDGPDGCMCGETYEAEEFFEMLKGKWRRGEWLKHPSGQTDVYESAPEGEEDKKTDFVKAVLKKHGWQGGEEGKGWDRDGTDGELSESFEERSKC